MVAEPRRDELAGEDRRSGGDGQWLGLDRRHYRSDRGRSFHRRSELRRCRERAGDLERRLRPPPTLLRSLAGSGGVGFSGNNNNNKESKLYYYHYSRIKKNRQINILLWFYMDNKKKGKIFFFIYIAP